MKRLSTKPFPAYTYIPGKTPHPVSDPAGHSYRKPDPHVDGFSPICWDCCETYVFGIDLFLAGYFWEAHVEWEAVWLAVGRHGRIADLVKGLIKLAAAGVKSLEGSEVGVARHLRRAAELFRSAAEGAGAPICGFDVETLIGGVLEITQRPSSGSGRKQRLTVVVKTSLRMPIGDC